MSARSVCSGTRPSRYHSIRAISAPPSRPEQLMRMPSAPRRMADCTARFIARRNATLRSSCCAIDVGTLLTDHHARTRRMDRHPGLLVRTLDHDLRHRGLLELLHQLGADLHVLVQQHAVAALAGVPARIPRSVDAETQPDRIYLLAHWSSPAMPRPWLRLRGPRWSGSRTV